MPLYSATQLVGKTMLLNHSVPVYSVADINAKGDKAKPIYKMQKGTTFAIDSYLLPTAGYTSNYGISYAARSTPYFTFFSADNQYQAIAIIADGRFSINALKDQGSLTVAEEIAAQKAEEKAATDPIGSLFDQMGFGGLSKFIKPLLIVVLIIILLPFIMSAARSVKQK